MIKILCGSYNKKDYVLDAFNSILDQTFRDWQLVILENSTDGDTREVVKQWVKEQKDDRIKLKIRNYSPEYRKKFYIPAQFINEEYNKRDADYYFWISDDDIIDPETLERLYIELQEDRRFVSYAGVQCTVNGEVTRQLKHDWRFGCGTSHNNVLCVLDGGSVLFKDKCLDFIPQPYYNELWDEDTSHCDGIFLQKLANIFTFYPVNEYLINHRLTKISTFQKSK